MALQDVQPPLDESATSIESFRLPSLVSRNARYLFSSIKILLSLFFFFSVSFGSARAILVLRFSVSFGFAEAVLVLRFSVSFGSARAILVLRFSVSFGSAKALLVLRFSVSFGFAEAILLLPSLPLGGAGGSYP